ncbi:MAG: 2-dehydro-3-deoxyphosphogluconate aldolase, partial [Verrucomicrobiales bacterium]|nr:2-dehydro-3-deoxyphosphogluconate aldolase [Verrucomicrobiales bacterium]
MRSRDEVISLLKNPGIIAVIRAQSAEQAILICDALVAGGIVALEITMTTPNALAAIADAKKRYGDLALVGVGTAV